MGERGHGTEGGMGMGMEAPAAAAAVSTDGPSITEGRGGERIARALRRQTD
jgi:hypothetical protein